MKNRKLLAVLIISVLLRIGAAFYLGNEVVPFPGAADQVSYHNLAVRVLEGHGFSFGEAWWPATAADAPTAHWSYLYTLYLVAVYAVVGVQPIIARLIQAILVGLLQPYLAYRLAEQLFSFDADDDQLAAGRPRLNWLRGQLPLIAASITGIYIYFVYYAATLMTEPFYFVTILASLSLAISLVRRNATSNRLSVALGLALASTVLLRQLYLLFVPFLFLWILLALYHQRRWKDSLKPVAISAGILVLSILPFTAYNYARFDRFVLLNTNAGFAFFLANHPFYGDSFIPASEMDSSYQQLIPAELRELDEATLDQALLKRGLQFVIDEPGRYIRLSISRIPEYFRFWPESASGLISNVSRVLSFGLFLPFMLVGLAHSVFDLVRQAIRRTERALLSAAAEPSTLLLLFVLFYAGIHILSWTQVRYRLPVDAVLVLFAALGIVDVASLLGRFTRATTHSTEGADPVSF